MGNIHIRAYGDFNSSEVDKEALNSTNISLHGSITELNTVGKNNRYKHFLMDLNDWVSANPPPVHLFLIFGSKEFSSSGILHRLRMCNYNILLACPGMPHVALCHAPTIMWDWSSLLKGEDLTGKHFNHPPDGPTNSRYGNSNVPLENPFSLVDFHTSSQNAEEIYKPTLDIKLCEASKSVSRQVMKILCSHPNGISIGDLRAELTKCDLPLDKRFYGNKKFSDFLVSMSYVQLQYLGGGNFWVRLVPSTTSAVKNKQKDCVLTQNLHDEGKNMDRSADGVPRISSSCVSCEGDDLKSFQFLPSQGNPLGEYADGKPSFPSLESNVHRPPDELQKKSLEVDVTHAPLLQIQLPPNDSNISKKSDNDIVKSDDVNPEIMEKINPSKNPSTCNDCNMLQNKHEIPTTKEVDEVCCSPFTSTFGSWISSWWTFWRSNAKSEVYESASHFEESKSSGLQYDLCHPQQPYWDNFKCRVSVWWDFDSCAVPSDISFLNVAPSIMGVLRANEIKSPICIDTYGDVSQLSKIKQEALFLSGIDLHHIPGSFFLPYS
ncbi:putative meiosis arrest female protein [Medicago truncatula]|uniref:Putative meiosis arrest female protein n=1 Tax=Medicago truncatula TaxID=3880 RepID=A0A396H131_MEDTR|nr:putative meiosis arrest female protein [Medicago truncatula]